MYKTNSVWASLVSFGARPFRFTGLFARKSLLKHHSRTRPNKLEISLSFSSFCGTSGAVLTVGHRNRRNPSKWRPLPSCLSHILHLPEAKNASWEQSKDAKHVPQNTLPKGLNLLELWNFLLKVIMPCGPFFGWLANIRKEKLTVLRNWQIKKCPLAANTPPITSFL